MALLNAVTEALTTVFAWISSFVTALTTDGGALSGLLPLFAVGISISIIFLGVKVVKSLIWGA